METFGFVILEAFANNTNVLASNVGAMEEIIEDGITGLIYKSNNCESFKEKISLYRNFSKLHKDKILTNAKQRVENLFSYDLTTKRIIQIIELIL